MNEKAEHLSKIERQFTRQGEAYTRLTYVKDDVGLKKVVALSKARATDSVLDVACGPGFLTLAFAEACERVVGVDTTEAFLIRAREDAAKREFTNVEFVNGNVEALEFSDALFDVVICRAAFHHFPDPEKVLGEMKRVTKLGGRIVVIDMLGSEDSEKATYHDRMERLCDPTHVRALPESEFCALFSGAGLQLQSTRKGKTSYSLSDWIGHGGPSPENVERIHEMMRASLEEDKSGLPVWKEDDEIHFSHPGAAFVLKR